MKQELYPLTPVISSSPQLSARYNADPKSIGLISECISVAQAESLLARGAVFNTVVMVDG